MALDTIQTHISQLEKVQTIDSKNADQINQILAQTDTELAQLKSAQEKTQAYNLILPQISKLKQSIKPAQKTDPKISQLNDRLVSFEAKIGERNTINSDIQNDIKKIKENKDAGYVRSSLRKVASYPLWVLGFDTPDWVDHKNNNPVQNFAMGMVDYFIDIPGVVEDVIRNPELLKMMGAAFLKLFTKAGFVDMIKQYFEGWTGDAYSKGKSFVDTILTLSGFGAALKGAGGLALAANRMEKISIQEMKSALKEAKNIARNNGNHTINAPKTNSISNIKATKAFETTGNALIKAGDVLLIPGKTLTTLPFEKLRNFLSARKNINGTGEIDKDLKDLNTKLETEKLNLSQEERLLKSIEERSNKLEIDFDSKFKTEILNGFPSHFNTKNAIKIIEVSDGNAAMRTKLRELADKIKDPTISADPARKAALETEITNFLNTNNGFPIREIGFDYTSLNIGNIKAGIIKTDDLIEKVNAYPTIKNDLNDLNITLQLQNRILQRVGAAKSRIEPQVKQSTKDLAAKAKEILGDKLDDILLGDDLKGKEVVLDMRNGAQFVFDVTDGPHGKLLSLRSLKGNGNIVARNGEKWTYYSTARKFESTSGQIIKMEDAKNILAQKIKTPQKIIDAAALKKNRDALINQTRTTKNILADPAMSGPAGLREFKKSIWEQALLSSKGLGVMQKQAENLGKFFSSYSVGKSFEIFANGKKVEIKRLPSDVRSSKPIFEVNGVKGSIDIKVVTKNGQVPRGKMGTPLGQMDIKLPDGTRFRVDADSLIWKENGRNFQISRYSKPLVRAAAAAWGINILNRDVNSQLDKQLKASISAYENGFSTGVFDSPLDGTTQQTGPNTSKNDSSTSGSSQNSSDPSGADTTADTGTDGTKNPLVSPSAPAASPDSGSDSSDGDSSASSGAKTSDSGTDQTGDTGTETGTDIAAKETIFDFDAKDFGKKENLDEAQKNQLLKILGVDISSAKNFLTNAKNSPVRLIPHNINGVDYDQEKFVEQTYKLFDAQKEKFVDFEHDGAEKKLFLQPGGGVHLDLSKISYLKQDGKTYYLASVSQESKMRGNYVVLGVQEGENFVPSLDFGKKQPASSPQAPEQTAPQTAAPATEPAEPQAPSVPKPTPQAPAASEKPAENTDSVLQFPKQDASVSEMVNVKNQFNGQDLFNTKVNVAVYDEKGFLKDTGEEFGDFERNGKIAINSGNIGLNQNTNISLDLSKMKKFSNNTLTYYFAPIINSGTHLDGKYIIVSTKDKNGNYSNNLN